MAKATIPLKNRLEMFARLGKFMSVIGSMESVMMENMTGQAMPMVMYLVCSFLIGSLVLW
jgi:hypothetical protein